MKRAEKRRRRRARLTGPEGGPPPTRRGRYITDGGAYRHRFKLPPGMAMTQPPPGTVWEKEDDVRYYLRYGRPRHHAWYTVVEPTQRSLNRRGRMNIAGGTWHWCDTQMVEAVRLRNWGTKHQSVVTLTRFLADYTQVDGVIDKIDSHT